MKFILKKITVFFFFIAVSILASVLVVFYYNARSVKISGDLVGHTQEVLRINDNILLDIINIEDGSRGFIITGNSEFLNPFYNSVLKIDSDLAKLSILTKDNNQQQLRIDTLRKVINNKLVFTKQSIEIRQNSGLVECAKIISSKQGFTIMNTIRKIILEIKKEELRLIKQRRNDYEKNTAAFEFTFLLLLACVFIILSFIVVNLQNQKRKNEIAKSEKQISQYSRSLLEASLDPLVAISAEGKITDVNTATENITGFSRNILIGTDFSDYFTNPEEARKGYMKVFEQGSITDYPLTICNQNNKLTDVLYNACVFHNENGAVSGVFAAARDITEQKRIAGLVIERSAQLETVNKELEAFTYSVSHDLRAPLRAINGYSTILQEDYAAIIDADGMNSLNAIMKNSKKMGELIDDLLAFSRLGKKTIPTTEINMSVLVNSVKEEELTGNNNEIKFNISELLPALGQQVLIKQVWVNLISNAVKYSKHKPQTTIEIGSYFDDKRVVYFVKDKGAGFDMKYYDKLFGVFQRLHSQEEFEGTGIGLAIVQKIINRHNGSVWAESVVNEGSSFYFSLPGIYSLS